VSEKLSSFISLYNAKATSEVSSATANVQKQEEKLARALELWEKAKAEATKLGVSDKFISLFPEAGGAVNFIIGANSVNPAFTYLTSFGEPLQGMVTELNKLRNAKSRVESSKQGLISAQKFAARKPEDHLKLLSDAIVGLAAKSSSLGAGKIKNILTTALNNYEGYSEDFIQMLEGVDGPSGVNSSKEAYEYLREKLDTGTLYKEETTANSPINETQEADTPAKTETGVINTPNTPKPAAAINPASPINNETTQKAENTETTGTAQANVTTKPNELKTEVPPIKPEEAKEININLENKAPSTDTKNGEIFSASPSINTTTNNSENIKSESAESTVNTTAINNTETKPSVTEDNRKSVFKSVVNNLKDTALNSLNVTNNPTLVNDFKKYLKVGSDKLEKVAKPAINTYSTIQNAVTEAKNPTTTVTTSNNAVNSSTSTTASNTEGATNTQMTTSQTSVDSKSPSIPKDVSLATPQVTNSPSLIEKSSQNEVANTNNVTYKESTQVATSPKAEKTETQSSQIIQQSSPVNINMGELINEMRAIKLLLMGGIDVNHK
jgi:hypothetical protein